jgi:hypothetical protein
MPHDLKSQLKELEESHISLEVRRSPEKLASLLADDFLEISSSGYKYGKKECLETGVVLTEMTLHEYEIYPLASNIVLSTYFIHDKTREKNTMRSSIWKLTNGEWQLSFHQGTVTPLEPKDFIGNGN